MKYARSSKYIERKGGSDMCIRAVDGLEMFTEKG
jgi:hypothetical protein